MFIGKTASGRILSHDECADIMESPVVSFSKEGDTYGKRDGATKEKPPHELDKLIVPDKYIRRTLEESDATVKESIEVAKARVSSQKIALIRTVESLRGEVKSLETGMTRYANIAETVKAEKCKTMAMKELRQREQSLFLDEMRLDMELEEERPCYLMCCPSSIQNYTDSLWTSSGRCRTIYRGLNRV